MLSETLMGKKEVLDLEHTTVGVNWALLTVVGECFQQAVQTALHAVSGAVCGR